MAALSTRQKDRRFSLVAFPVLALLCALWGGGMDPTSDLSLALGTVVLAFWVKTSAGVGRALALYTEPTVGGARTLWRAFLYAYAYALFSVELLGLVHALDTFPLTALHTVVHVLVHRHGRRDDSRRSRGLTPWLARARENPVVAVIVLLCVGLAAANAAWAWVAPAGLRDDFTYHLVFPVEWAQSGTLHSKLIPFGNHAPTYHPKNTEVFYTFLFLPLRQTAHLVGTQALFLAAMLVALYDTLRRCGASARAALVASVPLCASPVVVTYMASHYVDSAFALFFVLSVNAAIVFGRAPSRYRWLDLCLAVGLFLGTKMLGALLAVTVLLPLGALLLLPAARRIREASNLRGVAALVAGPALLVAGGGWWYVRNLWATGNPLFPMRVESLGGVLFDGAWSRSALPSPSPESLIELVTLPMLALYGVCAAWTVVAVFRRPGTKWLALVGVGAPVLVCVVFSALVPIGYARFALAAAALVAAAVVAPLDASRTTGRVAEVAILIGLVLSLVLSPFRETTLLPISFDALEWTPLVTAGFIGAALFLIAGVAAAVAAPRPGPVMGAVWVGLAFAAMSLATRTGDPEGPHVAVRVGQRFSPYTFVHETFGSARIAVTGTNESLRAFGRDFGNAVRYVHVADHGRALFHELVAEAPERREELQDDQSGAAYYREGADYETWLANLDDFGAEVLVVSRLPEWTGEQPYVRDAAGYPIEAAWAESHPERFERVFTTPKTRIYAVHARR